MNPDLFETGGNATPLDEDEQQGLIPSILTRADLNRLERANIDKARVWAMQSGNLQRTDLLTDAFAHELHRRMFNGVWRWAGQYRTTERNLGWEVHRLTEGVHNALTDAQTWLEHAT